MTGWNSWDELTQELPRLPPAFFDDPVFRPGGPPPVKDVGPAVKDGGPAVESAGPGFAESAGPGFAARPDVGRRHPGPPPRGPGRPNAWPGSADETVIIPPGSLDETVIIPPVPAVGPAPGTPPAGPVPRAGRRHPARAWAGRPGRWRSPPRRAG